MLLLRYQGESVNSQVAHDLEISHEEEINVLRLEIINKENPESNDDPILFDIDINEVDEFVNFIKDAAQAINDINESEEE